MRRFVGVALTASVALSVAGCGSASTNRDAHVAGVVKQCGGPTSQCATQRARISALDSHQNVVASVRTVNGEFSLDLAPGIYTVLAEENGYLFGKVAVDAVAHHATRANIIVTVK
jgi:hypothetical protein